MLIDITSKYKPTPKQFYAHEAKARWVLFGGAWRGAKTYWLAQHAKHLMMEYPGIEGLLGRYDFADLIEPTQLYDTFCSILESELTNEDYGGYHRRSYPINIRFPNSSRVTFSGLKDYKPGAGYGFIGIDQAEEVPPQTLELLNGRLAQPLADGSFPFYQMLLTCNPAPGFLKKAFIEKPDEDHVFIPAFPEDNPYIPPDYVEQQRKVLTAEDFKRYIRGSWDVFVGQALEEFDRNSHVIDPFWTWRDEQWPVYRGIDHGISPSPTVCLWLTVDPKNKNLFFIQEYTQTHKIAEENAKAILQLSAGMNIVGTWIDPRTATTAPTKEDREWSVFKEYNRQGVNCQLAHHRRETRFAAWKEALKVSVGRQHYLTHQWTAPRTYIFNICYDLIRTLPEVKRKEAEGTWGDDVLKLEDHWYDAGGFVLVPLLMQSPTTKPTALTFMQPSGKTKR